MEQHTYRYPDREAFMAEGKLNIFSLTVPTIACLASMALVICAFSLICDVPVGIRLISKSRFIWACITIWAFTAICFLLRRLVEKGRERDFQAEWRRIFIVRNPDISVSVVDGVLDYMVHKTNYQHATFETVGRVIEGYVRDARVIPSRRFSDDVIDLYDRLKLGLSPVPFTDS